MTETGEIPVGVSEKPRPSAPPPPPAARIPDFSLRSLFKRAPQLPGLAAVGIMPEGICIAYVDRSDDPPAMDVCDYKPCYSKEERRDVLNALVQTHGLRRARCTTVLEPGGYSLHLMDAPNVAPDEMQAAIRWRVKEFIDFPIDDAVIDVFDVPGRNLRGHGGRMIYAVVSHAAELKECIDLIEGAGLRLDVIDVPELALRNVAALLPEDWDGVALLHLSQRSGLITLTHQGTLYLARIIHAGTERLQRLRVQDLSEGERQASALNNALDGVVLEIRRALDYYERHCLNPPISSVIVTPVDDIVPGFIDYLDAAVGVDVKPLKLERRLQSLAYLHDGRLRNCLPTIGAALRHA